MNRGFEYKKYIGKDAAGLQVIEFLARRYPAFSLDEWLGRIQSGRVLLDGVAAKPDDVLTSGQILTWARPPWQEPEAPLCYAILYHDAYLLAAAKPSGLPTLPGGGGFMENTLLSLLRRRFPAASPLHRLGRGTSGIVLFALAQGAASNMLRQWNTGKILKTYRTLAAGHPKEDVFDIDVPVGPVAHKSLKTVHAASACGKPAHSHVRVLERRETDSLLEVTITTGRPHQIRIHLAAAGYPLVGDPLFIKGGIPAEDSRALPSDLGYLLHNGLLGFSHPFTGQWTEITCMPPPLLRTCYGPETIVSAPQQDGENGR